RHHAGVRALVRGRHLGVLRTPRSARLAAVPGLRRAERAAPLPGRPPGMNTQSFRQSNAWLHTWIGLLPGWLLYAVFFTGTLSFFQDEITFWMKPELHASQPQPDTAQRAVEALHALAPDAALWQINLPTERYPVVNVRWFA